jgi:hypothetical protein
MDGAGVDDGGGDTTAGAGGWTAFAVMLTETAAGGGVEEGVVGGGATATGLLGAPEGRVAGTAVGEATATTGDWLWDVGAAGV